MAIKKILRFPNPILREQVSNWSWEKDQDDFDIKFEREVMDSFVSDMKDTLEHSDRGAALAANQIGVLWRVFVVSPALAEKSAVPEVIINPRILEFGSEKETEVEGCLSFPGISVPVERSRDVRVSFEIPDDKMTPVTIEASLSGFIARVFQHEIDHLEGKLFVDQMPKREIFKIRTLMIKKG